MASRSATFLLSSSIALVSLALWPTPVVAHGGLQSLEMWGNFRPQAAYCQRIVGAAAASCALQVARLRQDCLEAQAGGLECTESATTAAIAAARRAALDLVDEDCTESTLITIGYTGNFDFQADLVNFCRQWEAVSSSAAFGTVALGNGALEPGDYECVAATAASVAKLARVIFDTWRTTMNRIAVRAWELESKHTMIDNCSARVENLESDAADALLGRCNPSRFEAIYHRSAAQLIHDVVARANCFPAAFYLQDKLTCPAPICGNWIIEPGEECDDGNTVAGDGCDGECMETVPRTP